MNFPRIILNFDPRISTTYNRTISLGLTIFSIASAAPIFAQTESNLPNNNPDQNASEIRVPEFPEALSLSQTLHWSHSAIDLQPLSQNLSQNLSTEPNPKELFLNKKSKGLTTSPDPNYIIPPRIDPKEKINPGTTTLPLNDIPISHLTEWQLSALQAFAETTNSDIFFNGTLKIQNRVIESLTRDNIYTVDQKGSYFQLRTVPLERTITTTTIEPQTMTGLELQMSLTGACIFSGTTPNQQCTYMPGLVIDRNSIDPKFFVPTRVFQTSTVGEVLKSETLAFVERPGFQGGTSSQPIGVDFYFPNTGAFPGNSQSQETDFQRKEEINYTLVGTFSRVRQVIKANDTEAVLGRTIRGFTLFFDDENRWNNTIIQAGAQLLPDVIPDLEGSEKPANPNINLNLFFAANNTRLPSSSFTIYSAGLGRAESLTSNITNLSQIPRANYHSLWFGLSPVIKRNFEDSQFFYQPTGPQFTLANAGAEGGANTDVQLISAVNQDTYSTANLQNFYAQVYLGFFQQNVNLVTENIYREKMGYYPHLSFTGDWTGSQYILRYYTGIIASEEVKPYLGTDYTRNTVNGWNFRGGAIGYINPDQDYYSQVWGGVAKIISFSKSANLTLSSGFNYAIDRDTTIGDVVSISPASEVAVAARLNWGIVFIGLSNYFGGILPNSYDNRLLAECSISPTKTLTLSGYIAPIDETSNRSLYGAGIIWQFKNQYNSPTLSFNWQNQQYDYGNDVFGNKLLVNDNIFTVLFRVGHPGNPFQSGREAQGKN
ncbi:conserved exported hypothetical protein [Planktothrix sp. PCC 11201]|uniref:hypothetical protein n=1 Tax=Planktothrix sp. PCC 11201 TaxID=1729650 RepID=UPI000915C900|nr:hypothetical protein [Planktothrix sp. PCC 11201]SKB11542.1 conserved exported hypothetical protein [Planktothrix sp. PCC 11201]